MNVKSVATISLARILIIISQLYYVKLLSASLEASSLGFYYLLTTISYFFNACFFVPLDFFQQARLYDCIKKKGNIFELYRLNKSVVFMLSCVVIICSALVFFFDATKTWGIMACYAFALFVYINLAVRNTLNNLGNSYVVCFLQVIEAAFKIIMLLVFIRFSVSGADALSVFSSNTFASLCASLIALYYFYKLCPISYDRKLNIKPSIPLSTVLQFAYPISIGALLNLLQLQGYRLALVNAGYAEMVGVFAAVTSLGQAGMAALSMIFSQMYLPEIYKTNGRYTSTYFRRGCWLTAFACGCAYLMAPIFVPLLTKDEFAPYAAVVVYGVLMEAGNFLIGGLSVKLTIVGQTRKMLWSVILATGSVWIGLYVMIQGNFVSLHALGCMNVLSQVIVAGYLYYMGKIVLRKV